MQSTKHEFEPIQSRLKETSLELAPFSQLTSLFYILNVLNFSISDAVTDLCGFSPSGFFLAFPQMHFGSRVGSK